MKIPVKNSAVLTFCFILTAFTVLTCKAGGEDLKNKLTIVFYNVENLFDVKNEKGKNDGEFTPKGSKKWTQERYLKKITDISRVISSVNIAELPEIVGFCEIENRVVVNDLTQSRYLKKGNYQIVHFESPDSRGIDNALIYRPDEFSLLYSRPIRISFAEDSGFVTRDILYVKGQTTDHEVLHIFVNHWPSRIGGDEGTESKRIRVASVLRGKVDSLFAAEKNPNIIILGDMNDEPVSSSLFNTLKAKDPAMDFNADLLNLMFEVDKKELGSYKYRNQWNMLDNIVVSRSLLNGSGFRCTEKQGFVFDKGWMEFKNRNGNISPNKTYSGEKYTGGISDHFPVYFKLIR
jgi:predicted extracellular nuclease